MTNSAEHELEATIWAAMTGYCVTTKKPLEFIEAIKAAAMDYAAGDSDALTETRRMILHEATRPERTDPPVVAGGGGQAPHRELNPPGSRARPPVGATLSTGHVVPMVRQGSGKFHPQAVDEDVFPEPADPFAPGTALAEQIRAIKALYTGQFGIKDRDKQLETTRAFLGLDMLASHTRLSYRQAGDLLLAMRTKLSEKAVR